MASLVFDYVINRSDTREWLKSKAHDWLPAYFSRYDLTPEENLLIDQKNALQAALIDKDSKKLTEILNLFPNLINQPLNNGEVPITFAVKQNLQDKINILLERGADPVCKDRVGLNALDIALQKQEKQLFAKLIAKKFDTTASADRFIKTLDSPIVTGSAAKNALKSIEADAKKVREELKKINLSGDEKTLFRVILNGDFVQFKQIATPQKISHLSVKVASDQLLSAAVLGSPLILDAMLSMGFEPIKFKYSSSEHPMRFALCSRHPVEAYIPLFSRFQFNIHSLASPKNTSSENMVRYFDLLVYQKKRNSQNMDPLAVTVWDIAFAAFSLLSFAANYNYLPLPASMIPWARSGLNVANYLQAISLLLFKVSYAREGKIASAIQQLLTHYVASLFLPVRLYYAFMTVYSGWNTCLEHKYRSYTDLCKKMIIQLPAAAEIAHHTADVAIPYFKALYCRFFGGPQTTIYNWNHPDPNQKISSNGVVPKQDGPLLDNTEFMNAFSKQSLNVDSTEFDSTELRGSNGITGPIFSDPMWIYQGKTPQQLTQVSAAIELGKNFHTNTTWFQNVFKGTLLETAYRQIHLQGAVSGQLQEYSDGFSVQGAIRVDFTGLSAIRHFIETILEGGAHFEQINNRLANYSASLSDGS